MIIKAKTIIVEGETFIVPEEPIPFGWTIEYKDGHFIAAPPQ